MQTITTIGLDIAKSVFQVHGTRDIHGEPHALVVASPPPTLRLGSATVCKKDTLPQCLDGSVADQQRRLRFTCKTAAAHGPTQFAHGWAVVTLQLVDMR
jgi:hypothetical protein